MVLFSVVSLVLYIRSVELAYWKLGLSLWPSLCLMFLVINFDSTTKFS